MQIPIAMNTRATKKNERLQARTQTIFAAKTTTTTTTTTTTVARTKGNRRPIVSFMSSNMHTPLIGAIGVPTQLAKMRFGAILILDLAAEVFR